MNSLANRNIVIIDDAPAILTFLRASLESLGATCHEAQTASGGLALCEQVKPDLVILDLGLPDKEGFTILPRIKRLDKHSHLPVVIVLTVRNEARWREMSKELGADAYLTKPFRMEDLVEVIYEKLGIAPGDYMNLVRQPFQPV